MSQTKNDNSFKDPTHKNSVNQPNILHESDNSENVSDRDREFKYERRMGRQFSINVHASKDNKFQKVIVPYNFDKKLYAIKKEEVEFFEKKKYLKEKLDLWNVNPAFNIEHQFEAKGRQNIYLYVPTIIIFILVIYLSIVLCAYFSFNIIVIYTVGSWLKKGYNSLQMFKFILLEKFKIKEIHKIINEENNCDFCINHKLRWSLGQSGYWLELQKLVE